MKLYGTTLAAILGLAALALLAVPGAIADPESTPAAGLIQFDPPQVRGCIAVRVAVPEDKMLVGMRWFNGSLLSMIPNVLVGTGNGITPPVYSEAELFAEDVQGLDRAWSETLFENPVASESGTLFLIVEYPADYAAPPTGPALGVGFAREQATHPYFVSGDGDNWIKVASRCRVLLEPILADRAPGVATKRAVNGDDSDIPMSRWGLYAAPNPFNPQTEIALYLDCANRGDVRIFDIRGRLVKELHRGQLAQGENSFVWDGRDSTGRGAASGPYWVHARLTDETHTIKVMLLK